MLTPSESRGCGRFAAKGMKLNAVAKKEKGLADDEKLDLEDQEMGGGFTSIDEIKEARPPFLKECNIMDKVGKRPWEEGYDEKTLYIPPDAWTKFTPAMKQYWKIK